MSRGYEFVKYAAIERQHEAERSEYYSRLHQHQGNSFYEIPSEVDIGHWIHYWLGCALRAAEESHARVLGAAPEEDLALPSHLQKAVGLFRRHRRLTASDYQQLTGLGRTQSVADLKCLEREGWIRREGGGRSTVYLWVEGRTVG